MPFELDLTDQYRLGQQAPKCQPSVLAANVSSHLVPSSLDLILDDSLACPGYLDHGQAAYSDIDEPTYNSTSEAIERVKKAKRRLSSRAELNRNYSSSDEEARFSREKSLLRNRQAVSRSREKAKVARAECQASFDSVNQRRAELTAQVARLREEVLQLKTELLQHFHCDCIMIQQYLASVARRICWDYGTCSPIPSSLPFPSELYLAHPAAATELPRTSRDTQHLAKPGI